MALTFVLSGPLRELAGNASEVQIDGRAAILSDALALLWQRYPAFRDRVITERGELRPHLNIFVDGESIRWSGGFDTAIHDRSEIVILPALSGG